MAYVAISGDFLTRVKSKIEKMTRAELATIGEEPKPTCSGHEPFIVNAMWTAEHAHFKDKIPTEWCGRTERLNIKFEIPGQLKADGKPHLWHSDIKFTSDIKTPPRFSSYDSHPVPNNEPMLATLVDWVIKQQEIVNRWKAVETKIFEFLHSCKSANEAVKLWPDVKTYFDAGDVARLETKQARSGSDNSSAAQVLAGIDTSEVMSAAVIARLSGAQM